MRLRTKSELAEVAMAEAAQTKRNQLKFIARGKTSLAEAKASNEYVDADAIIKKLEHKLAAAKARR